MDTQTSPGDELANAIHQDILDAQAAEDASAASRDALRKKVLSAVATSSPDKTLRQITLETDRLMAFADEDSAVQAQDAVQASLSVVSAVHVRPDTKKALALLEEAQTVEAWEKLSNIASEEYPHLNRHQALRQACLDNPLLYQEWQDSLPELSRVPLRNA